MREKEGREERDWARGSSRGGKGREIVKDKGGDRAITKKETHGVGGNARESSASILSALGIPSGSLQDLFSHCLQKCVGRERGGEERRGDGTMRARLARHCHPFLLPFSTPAPSGPKPPKSCRLSSLFLTSRACENSGTQAAFGPRRILEDVQETSYTARIIRD